MTSIVNSGPENCNNSQCLVFEKNAMEGLCGCSVANVMQESHFKLSDAAFRLAPPIGRLLVELFAGSKPVLAVNH